MQQCAVAADAYGEVEFGLGLASRRGAPEIKGLAERHAADPLHVDVLLVHERLHALPVEERGHQRRLKEGQGKWQEGEGGAGAEGEGEGETTTTTAAAAAAAIVIAVNKTITQQRGRDMRKQQPC